MLKLRQWGGDLELNALADFYKVTILIHIKGKEVE
jgi:hypothetical protein